MLFRKGKPVQRKVRRSEVSKSYWGKLSRNFALIKDLVKEGYNSSYISEQLEVPETIVAAYLSKNVHRFL
jgi:hypothetical protein